MKWRETVNLHLKSDLVRNVAALFIGIAVTIILVVVFDKTFGWVMDIKVSKSHFFPENNDIDGLGWNAKDKGSLEKRPAAIPLRTKIYLTTK